MSSFTTPLRVEPDSNGQRWTLIEDFVYWTIKENRGIRIDIPAGFQTDFASIPRILWNLLPPFGLYGKAAVVHDFLYQQGGRFDHHRFNRARCDEVFLYAMASLSVPWLTRQLLYTAVRLFGWSYFQRRKG